MTATATRSVSKPQPLPPRQNRMKLDAVISGKLKKPITVVCYGPEGVGKSSFGAGAPGAIFVGAEDGTAQLDVKRFPSPQNYLDIIDAVRTLRTEQHEYQTLVMDTMDWIEPLLWQHVCQRDGQANIEAYGYGKGYQVALDEWRMLLSELDRLVQEKRMNVVLLAHSQIRPFKNPQGEDFDRYELKVHAKAAGLIKEWAEAVLFANWETFAKEDKRTKRVKGVSSGARLIYTERTAAFDAKNRYSLPEELPLSWADFDAAVNAGQVAPVADLRAEIERKALQLGGELETKILETLVKAGDNAESLALINNRCNARIAELAEKDGQ
jgi:ribosome assembly protein YihI (activator of Der GTPase)